MFYSVLTYMYRGTFCQEYTVYYYLCVVALQMIWHSKRLHYTTKQVTAVLEEAGDKSCYGTQKRERPMSFLANKQTVPDHVRLAQVGNQFPQQNKNFQRCCFCSTTKAEKRSRYTCTACDVPLCLEPCFRKFHKK